MKIIDCKLSTTMGHDGVDYFFVYGEMHHRIVFSYLTTGVEFWQQQETSGFYYFNSRGNYRNHSWELAFGGDFDIVKEGKVHRTSVRNIDPFIHNYFSDTSNYSPQWCIICQTQSKVFSGSLELLGQQKLAKTIPTVPREILIVNRLSGEIQTITSPFDIAEKVVIALDEQTFAIPGRGQIAIIDLNF